MKKTSALLVALVFALSSCASLNRKVASNQTEMSQLRRQMLGKTPKSVKQALGEPFSVGWFTNIDGTRVYYVAYPHAENQNLSTMDIMMDKTIECDFLYFYNKNNYKFAIDVGDLDSQTAACSHLQDRNYKYEYDDSLVNQNQ